MTAILEIPRGEADYRPDRTSEGSFFASWSENVTPGGVEGGGGYSYIYIYIYIYIFIFFWGGGGGGGVPPSPENPYPISDQNIRFSIPHFKHDSQNVYQFQTL